MKKHMLRALWFLALLPCCSNAPHPFGDAGDISQSDSRRCASNADCNDQTPCTQDLCLVGGTCSNMPMPGACDGGTCVSGVGCTGSGVCTSNADCNDRIDCTADACLVNGTCQHTPNNNLCPPGQMCAAAGCVQSCANAADCDDHIDCTVDLCQSDGRCLHTAQNNRCPAPQVCIAGIGCSMPSSCASNAECDDHVYCNGVETCSAELACVSGTPVNCDDMTACTIDMCSESMMMCTHTMDPACSMNVHSGIFNVSPAATYSCAFGLYTLNVSFVQFALSGGTLTVTGGPTGGAPMTSPAPTGSSFDVMGTNLSMGGGCDEHYHMTGMFTDATHITGTLTVSFTDPGTATPCDPLYGCSTQMLSIAGTAR